MVKNRLGSKKIPSANVGGFFSLTAEFFLLQLVADLMTRLQGVDLFGEFQRRDKFSRLARLG